MTPVGQYILDKNRNPVLTEDAAEWGRFLMVEDNRRVAFDEIGPGVFVSTVFLGLDHNYWGDGPPILFETMVKSDYGWDDKVRYATWAEAEAGHRQVVEQIRAMSGLAIGTDAAPGDGEPPS